MCSGASHWPRSKIVGFVLTIDGPDGLRRQNAIKQLKDIPIAWSFSEGLRQEDTLLDDLYASKTNRLLSKYSLTRAELAVYAGHRRIWEKVVLSGSDFAVVFEDDFHLLDKERFLATIHECIAVCDRWDIVKFFDFRSQKKVARRLELATTSLVAHKYPATGAVAYLIRREAVPRLLARRKVFRAVDEDLSCPWEFGIRVWSTSLNLVEEISHDLGGSLLEVERLQKKRRRSALRSLWGECLAAHKNLRARFYQHGLKA